MKIAAALIALAALWLGCLRAAFRWAEQAESALASPDLPEDDL